MLVLISVIAASLCLFCAACGNGVNTDWSGVCDLKTAYENKYLTKSDLEKIAGYHNNDKDCETPLRTGDALALQKLLADSYNEGDYKPSGEASADNFEILKFYGIYFGCYVILIDDLRDTEFWAFPPIPYPYDPDEAEKIEYEFYDKQKLKVDGVEFKHIYDGTIVVCRFDTNKNNGGNLI